MKLVQFNRDEDWGQDYYLKLLFNARYALIQLNASWSVYSSWPYLQIQFGQGGLFAAFGQIYKLGFSIGFIERTWNL